MSEMLTRRHARPREVRLRVVIEDPTTMTRIVKWSAGTMYRYSHNRRLRAAFLLDRRLGRCRG